MRVAAVSAVIVVLAFASVTSARNIRCPSKVVTNSVFANKLSPSKYFRCTPLRLLEELDCNNGDLFDPKLLICHKPMPGRCACPEPTTPCPCPTTACPCPTTTTSCPCPTVTPSPQILGNQNAKPYLVPCQNCVHGSLQTSLHHLVTTPLPALTYDVFGVRDVPFGPVIVTDSPPRPC